MSLLQGYSASSVVHQSMAQIMAQQHRHSFGYWKEHRKEHYLLVLLKETHRSALCWQSVRQWGTPTATGLQGLSPVPTPPPGKGTASLHLVAGRTQCRLPHTDGFGVLLLNVLHAVVHAAWMMQGTNHPKKMIHFIMKSVITIKSVPTEFVDASGEAIWFLDFNSQQTCVRCWARSPAGLKNKVSTTTQILLVQGPCVDAKCMPLPCKQCAGRRQCHINREILRGSLRALHRLISEKPVVHLEDQSMWRPGRHHLKM